MSGLGFGEPRQSETDELIERIVRYCRQRNPESLDRIFDNMRLNRPAMVAIAVALQEDIEALSWFCSYMASETNRSEDNLKSCNPIKTFSGILIKFGMQPFLDFVPYPGARIIISNQEKFKALPETIKVKLEQAFNIQEHSPHQVQKINDALMQELMA
ncbi:MAG: hypothetical protein F6K58_32215 [Symploca sp. SIO2E9]|nr:hypothetical protein [Symploca sp. SIO2E9]